MNIKVIFDDQDILVIDKPSGMIVDEVQKQFGEKAILVHRLDRDTSGVIVVAKNERSAAALRKQFEERKVIKKYQALVHGQMKQDQGLITTPLAKNPKNRARVVVGGELDRSAITDWKVLQHFADYSLLELTPHTGRTHQLRVHLKSTGHPIVSDPMYGFAKKLKTDLSWCPRLFLHARHLEFTHPTTGQIVKFDAPLSSDLETVLRSLT